MCPRRRVETGQKYPKAQWKGQIYFFSPAEVWCHPAPSVTKPEEREFVVDPGVSMHMLSRKNRIQPNWRHWMDEEGNTENCLAQCQRSGSICDPIQARTLVLLDARVRKYVVEGKFRTSRKLNIIALQMLDILKCHTSPEISGDRAIIAWTVEGMRKNYQGTRDNKKILTYITLAINLLFIYNRICQWYETENLVHTPRRAEREE